MSTPTSVLTATRPAAAHAPLPLESLVAHRLPGEAHRVHRGAATGARTVRPLGEAVASFVRSSRHHRDLAAQHGDALPAITTGVADHLAGLLATEMVANFMAGDDNILPPLRASSSRVLPGQAQARSSASVAAPAHGAKPAGHGFDRQHRPAARLGGRQATTSMPDLAPMRLDGAALG